MDKVTWEQKVDAILTEASLFEVYADTGERLITLLHELTGRALWRPLNDKINNMLSDVRCTVKLRKKVKGDPTLWISLIANGDYQRIPHDSRIYWAISSSILIQCPEAAPNGRVDGRIAEPYIRPRVDTWRDKALQIRTANFDEVRQKYTDIQIAIKAMDENVPAFIRRAMSIEYGD